MPITVRPPQVSPGKAFFDFYSRLKDRPPLNSLPLPIIALDPGETTGVCEIIPPVDLLTDEPEFVQYQINTSIIEWGIDAYGPIIGQAKVAVIESYRIYAWRAKEHTWASLLTPRLIGVAETFSRLNKIPLLQQSAQTGKAFVTDERLKQWGLYIEGQQHARDSTRHLCQQLLFGKWEY